MKSKRIKKQTPTNQELRFRQQAARAERVANGLCRYCTKPQLPGHNYCQYHHDYHRLHNVRHPPKRDSMGRKRPYRGKGYNHAVRSRLKAVLDGVKLCDLVTLSEKDISRLANCSPTTAHYAKKKKLKELIK
jgi:hypothetical protein